MNDTKNTRENVPKWERQDILYLYEDSNALLYHLPEAEEGLADKSRPPAAHAECRVFARSFFVLRSLARLLYATHFKIHKPFEYYRLSDELVAQNGCPCYLDTVEEYIREFGDAWFNEDYHRDLLFVDITDAFISIIENAAILIGKPIEKQSEFNFTLGSFMEEFKDAARRENHRYRASATASLARSFKRIRKSIEGIFDLVPAAEKKLLSTAPLAKPLPVTRTFGNALESLSKSSRGKGDLLLKRLDDSRPNEICNDSRYDRIELLQAVWHRMPPSVTRFVELCRLVEEGAILATKNGNDIHFSQRNWVASAFHDLADHPKRTNAKTIADLVFTDSEKNQMSVAFKGMSTALLRYRSRIKACIGIGHVDPDEYDDFVRILPRTLGPETRDYKAFLFEEDSAHENDDFNSLIFRYLCGIARPRLRLTTELVCEALDNDKKEVEGVLKRAFATGSRETIESTYDKLIAKYFKNKGNRPKQSDKADSTLDISPTETAPNIDIPEPGKDFKQVDRFAYAPKFRTIIDMDHRGGTYCLKAYENLTAASVVEIIKTLVNAIGKKDGWVKASQNWRIRFKDQPYKRFKNEQIEVGTRANQHLGEWRIIPRDYFQELTKALKVIQPKPSHR